MIVTISFLAVYLKVGSQTLLKHAVVIKPYAKFYLSTDWIEEPQESTHKLVFFFGDSTLQRGFDENHEGTVLDVAIAGQVPGAAKQHRQLPEIAVGAEIGR